jgi:tetratricopeptide (TPR) repeat protein
MMEPGRNDAVRRAIVKGLQFQAAGRLREAEYQFQVALKLNPTSIDALNRLGLLAYEAKRFDFAVNFLAKAISLRPADMGLRTNLANALLKSRRPKDAMKVLARIDRQSALPETFCTLAKAYADCSDLNGALDILEQACRKHPSSVMVQRELADLLSEAGRFSEADARYRAILGSNPYDVIALLGYSVVHRFAPGDPDIAWIEGIARACPEDKRAAVHHVAAKMYHELRRYDEAFDHFVRSKASARREFSIKDYRQFVSRMIEAFPPTFFEPKERSNSVPVPVFIVGMPRSGTSLVEQICASHPKVWGAGERTDFADLLNETAGKNVGGTSFRVRFGALPSGARHEIREKYLLALAPAVGNYTHIVNKLPHNFEFLGAIAVIFPNARVIHCVRNPLDTCLSCFMQPFSKAHSYNRDLETLGLYYVEYRRLMEHWKCALPFPLLDVSYERLVSDPEPQIRRMIEFMELDWDDSCLRFHEASRNVQTPSRWQVRQPMYRTSINMADAYGRHLGPLVESLRR